MQSYRMAELRGMADRLGISRFVEQGGNKTPREMSRESLVTALSRAMLNVVGFRRLGRLGSSVRLVTDYRGHRYALKAFPHSNSRVEIRKEYSFLLRAYKVGAAPKPVQMDCENGFIVMELMDCTLAEQIARQKGRLFGYQQKRILSIYKALDDTGIYHNDGNLANYMVKDRKIFLLDYGLSKDITPQLVRKLGTNRPNSTLALLRLVTKLHSHVKDEASLKHLVKALRSDAQRRLEM